MALAQLYRDSIPSPWAGATALLALLLLGCGDVSDSQANSSGGAGGSGNGGASSVGADAPSSGAGGEGEAGGRSEPDWPAPIAATTLPLEVLGAPGVGVEAVLSLTQADLDAALTEKTELSLTLQNILEPDSAQVSLNDGAPIDLGAAAGPWLRRHDGRVAAGSVVLEPRLLRAGENRLLFRYTRQVVDGAAVSGFRVLGAAIAIGARRIALELPAADPNDWQPYDASADALERGRGYFQDESRDGGPSCARCHADSGADLKYYAFSNESIAERAIFHQFSRAEAEDIASYIRSLAVVAAGRAYDSPFQPGVGNHGAAGAGYGAVLGDDAAFAASAFGSKALPTELRWDWAAEADPFLAPASVATPTWLRWLPRELDPSWFERDDGLLGAAEQRLAEAPTLENAQTFMSAALTVGKELVAESGDYPGKIEVLRFAAVKLWDWSRKNGFDAADHGVPDGSPAYPYEVGFAFFEAAQSGAVAGAALQTMQWWWVQLATNPGRGLSTGKRPLNFQDVLSAAESAALGSSQIAFLHLYGSWEESRGALSTQWHSAEGPVRLLLVPMRDLPAADRVAVMRRFLQQERAYLDNGGVLDKSHHQKLSEAWSRGCAALSAAQRLSLRDEAPAQVVSDLAACP
jgi:hypothetical protein